MLLNKVPRKLKIVSRSVNGRIAKTHGGYGTPEYSAWRAMIKRCYDPATASYPDYGGRGITVCEAWRTSFVNFIADVGKRPTSDYSLGRVDNEGNYEPSNCEWQTRIQQQGNRRSVRVLEHQGQKKPLAVWARDVCISRATLSQRLRLGWPIDKALYTPADKRRASR